MTTATYARRYRMEMSLESPPEPAVLPRGFEWLPWREDLLETHAQVKWRSFDGQLDTTIFPKLASLAGCVELMHAIRDRSEFVPEATWLIARRDRRCGTIQGIRDSQNFGAIQNVGVRPEWRGLGLGRALLRKSIEGFRVLGLTRVFLEVTARNTGAIRLYHDMGFSIKKTLYREIAPSQDWYSI